MKEAKKLLNASQYTDQSIKKHESLLLEIAHALTHKGRHLVLQTFVSTIPNVLENSQRNQIFPRQ